jgi:hypothetical protein
MATSVISEKGGFDSKILILSYEKTRESMLDDLVPLLMPHLPKSHQVKK